MSDTPAIELPKRTRLVFVGGAEKIIPLSVLDFRNSLRQAGHAGALFITVPLVVGTLDFNINNLAYFEQAFSE